MEEGTTHLLVIRPGAIGDTLLTFPILKALRTQYAHPHVTLMGNASVLPLALALGVADEALDYGQGEWSDLFSTRGIRHPRLQVLLRRTDRAICWLRDPDGMIERNLRGAGIKDVLLAPGRPGASRIIHETWYLAETIDLPDASLTALSSAPYRLPSPDTQRIAFPEQPIAIHPGSSAASKCWPPAHFAAVIKRLWQRNIPILLLAGPADHEHLAGVLDYLSSSPQRGRLKVLEDAPLLEVAQDLTQCKGYLGNDSGITHLAAMLGLPTIALFGPSDPAIWHPLGPSIWVIQENALEQLPVDSVMDVLDSF